MEISGLKKLRIYALINFISIFMFLSLSKFLQITSFTTQQPISVLLFPSRELHLSAFMISFLVLGVILELGSLIILRLGFKDILQVGRNVNIGVTGTTLYIISLPVLLIGEALIRHLPAAQISPADPTLPLPYFGAPLLVLIGGLMAIVGAIAVIVGLFKVGSIYREALIKAGAVLTIFPYLNILAPFLLILGLGNAISKVQRDYPGQ